MLQISSRLVALGSWRCQYLPPALYTGRSRRSVGRGLISPYGFSTTAPLERLTARLVVESFQSRHQVAIRPFSGLSRVGVIDLTASDPSSSLPPTPHAVNGPWWSSSPQAVPVSPSPLSSSEKNIFLHTSASSFLPLSFRRPIALPQIIIATFAR